MKKRLVLVWLLSALFLANIAQGQAQYERSFENLGYRNESIIGISGAITYFLKLEPRDDINKTKLVLHIKPSPVLNPVRSTVTIALRDEPVYTQRIFPSTYIDSMLIIEIPMDKRFVQPDGRYVKVRVEAKMAISDEYCQDVDNPAVWISIRNSSHLAIIEHDQKSYNHSLRENIFTYNTIATPVNSDLDDLMSGAVIYALLKKKPTLLELNTTNFSPADDTLNDMIITGLVHKLPANIRAKLPVLKPNQGCITEVHPYNDARQVLVVTGITTEGYRKAIYTLTNYKILFSSFSDIMLIDIGTPNYFKKNTLPVVFSLEELGAPPRLLEGVGALKSNFTFSLSDYNAIPQKLVFHLETLMTFIKEDDRGFLNVYLNESLVYTTDIHNMTTFSGDIDLKPYLLTKNNSLVVELRFHGKGSVCKEGFSNFFAFVDPKTTTLAFSGEKPNEFYNFFNYPGEFRKKPLKFVISPSLIPYLSASMGGLLHQLNATTIPSNYLYLPELISSDKANVNDISDHNTIALLHRNDPFINNFGKNLPVQFNKNFQLYKDISGATAYSLNDFSESGIAQIFRQKNSTYLVVTVLGDSAVKQSFEGVIKSFGAQYSAIESNVCIANAEGKSNYFFKLPDNSGLVSYREDGGGFANVWKNYRFFILIGLLFILLFGFILIRNRVKKSQEIV